MAFFVVHAGFYSKVREKTKAFLTPHLLSRLTGIIILILANFITVTRTINLRRCMASDLKYTSFLKTGRSFIENLVVWS